MGRPQKPIDWDKVEKWMWAGLSGAEISGRFNMHHDTFYARFQEKYNTSFASMALYDREIGNGFLREKQFNEAMTGNNSQLTKLCEVRLGQGKSGEDDQTDIRGIITLAQELKELKAALLAGGVVLPGISTEQPLPHQGCERQQDQVPDELGTKDIMEREA